MVFALPSGGSFLRREEVLRFSVLQYLNTIVFLAFLSSGTGISAYISLNSAVFLRFLIIIIPVSFLCSLSTSVL